MKIMGTGDENRKAPLIIGRWFNSTISSSQLNNILALSLSSSLQLLRSVSPLCQQMLKTVLLKGKVIEAS